MTRKQGIATAYGVAAKWRTGEKLGRTLYAQLGDEPSPADPFLGIMETPALARHVVSAMNALREKE